VAVVNDYEVIDHGNLSLNAPIGESRRPPYTSARRVEPSLKRLSPKIVLALFTFLATFIPPHLMMTTAILPISRLIALQGAHEGHIG
jgi:hypothetical protein